MALGEESREDTSQGAELVEEPDPADADRAIALGCQAPHEVWSVEHAGRVGGRLAPGEARREEP